MIHNLELGTPLGSELGWYDANVNALYADFYRSKLARGLIDRLKTTSINCGLHS